MTRYEFPSMVAKDPTQDFTVKSGTGYVFAPGDFTFSTPLATYDRYGTPKSAIGCTSEGLTEEFYCDDQPVVWWKSAGYAFLISSFTGMLAATQLAEAAAEDAAGSARAAAAAAQTALSGMASATDAGVTGLVNDTTSNTRKALDAIFAAVGMAAKTADTAEDYKAILFSDGTVRAVPRGAAPPAAPTGLAVVPTSTAAKLTWTASPGAVSYLVFRDGNQIASVTNPSYRNNIGTPGGTYAYQVSAVNAYNMHSPLTSPVTAYLDPALNVPPTVSVTTWPTTIPTTGRCYVRVNASDADAQTLALALSVSTGSLQPTTDPSVWILSL